MDLTVPKWLYWMAFFGMTVIAVLVIVGLPVLCWWALNHISISIH